MKPEDISYPLIGHCFNGTLIDIKAIGHRWPYSFLPQRDRSKPGFTFC